MLEQLGVKIHKQENENDTLENSYLTQKKAVMEELRAKKDNKQNTTKLQM